MSGIFDAGTRNHEMHVAMLNQENEQKKELARERAQQERQKAQLREQELTALRGRFGGMQDSSPAPQPDAQDADQQSNTQDLFQRLTGRLSDFV